MADVNKTILLEYDLKTGKLIDENGKVIKSLEDFINQTKKATQAQQQMGDAIGKNSEVILGSADHIRKQIQVAKQQREVTSTNNEEYLRQTMVITGLEQRLQQITKTTSDFSVAQGKAEVSAKGLSGSLNKNLSGSAGLAGAATFELGRLVSDLPFGFVAISNNLSQLGMLFGALVSGAGSFSNALKLMRIQLMNPVTGVLMAFQLVNAAFTFLSNRSKETKKDLNELTKEIASSTSKLKTLANLIDTNGTSFERLSILIKQVNDENNNLNLSLEDSEESFRLTSAQIKEYVKALELAAKVKSVQNRIESEFETILKEQQEQSENTVASYNFIAKGYNSIKNSIIGFYEGVTGASVTSEKKIADSQFRITQLLIELELLFGKGFKGDPKKSAEEGANEILKLQEDLALARIKVEEDRLNKELEIINDKLKSEKITEEESLKLLIRREDILDGLAEIANKRNQDRLDSEEKLADLNKQLILESISDDRLRLQQKILFIDEEMSKEKEGTEEYIKLQLEKIKAVNALAAAEIKAANDSAKEDERVNSLKQKLFQQRISKSEVLEKKWLKSQIDSLTDILQSESLSNEQRAQSELDLFNFKQRLLQLELDERQSVLSSIKMALDTVSEVFNANAQRQIDVETNKTNSINDKLRERLSNEKLTADQRDEINQQIARNEAELVKKENEINKKRFEQQKALQVAQALVETYRTAWLAFGSQLVIGDPTSPVRAQIAQAVTLAAGLANVALIARQQFVGKALPSPSLTGLGGSEVQSSGPSFNVVGNTQTNQLANAVEAALSRTPIKSYVVSSDVTTAQELERKIVEGASI